MSKNENSKKLSQQKFNILNNKLKKILKADGETLLKRSYLLVKDEGIQLDVKSEDESLLHSQSNMAAVSAVLNLIMPILVDTTGIIFIVFLLNP